MASEIQSELQHNVARYLKGDLQLSEFEDWFLPVVWALNDSEDEPSRQLAGRIGNLIAETSRGDRTLESLHKEMGNAVRPYVDATYASKTIEFSLMPGQISFANRPKARLSLSAGVAAMRWNLAA
jgi:hypothetical protein